MKHGTKPLVDSAIRQQTHLLNTPHSGERRNGLSIGGGLLLQRRTFQ